MFMWLFLDIASAVIIGFVFCYNWIKEIKRERWLEAAASSGLLHSETITDITENNDASQQKPEVAPTSANLAPENMIELQKTEPKTENL